MSTKQISIFCLNIKTEFLILAVAASYIDGKSLIQENVVFLVLSCSFNCTKDHGLYCCW